MRFLCLHGRTTSAKILEVQTARIREDLVEHDFVYFNGDIPLQSCDNGISKKRLTTTIIPQRDFPYKLETHVRQGAATTGEDSDGDLGSWGYLGEPIDVNQYQDLLDGLVDEVRSQGPFDGVMGFSEGGVVAATLLLEDARRPFAGFKCGILFSAAPPLDPDDLRAGVVRCLDPEKDGVSLHVPTAHIFSRESGPTGTDTGGIANPRSPLDKLWSEAGWSTPEQVHNSLACLCDNAEIFVHEHGHQVPGPRHHQALRGVLRAISRTVERVTG